MRDLLIRGALDAGGGNRRSKEERATAAAAAAARCDALLDKFLDPQAFSQTAAVHAVSGLKGATALAINSGASRVSFASREKARSAQKDLASLENLPTPPQKRARELEEPIAEQVAEQIAERTLEDLQRNLRREASRKKQPREEPSRARDASREGTPTFRPGERADTPEVDDRLPRGRGGRGLYSAGGRPTPPPRK